MTFPSLLQKQEKMEVLNCTIIIKLVLQFK